MPDTSRSLHFIQFLFLAICIPVAVSADPGDYSYSIVHLSDTQTLSRDYPGTLNLTFASLESIREANNISAIIITGDLVDSGTNETQWLHYSRARALTSIPLYEVSGNHDIGGSAQNYTTFDSWIGNGKRNWNADIEDFLFIGIGYRTAALSSQEIDSYTTLIESEPEKKLIIATHDYFDGITYTSPLSPLGTSLKTRMVMRDPTIIMAGHMHGIIQHTCDYNQNVLVEDMTDYQTWGNYSAGKIYTVNGTSGGIDRITVRDLFIVPSLSLGPEMTMYPKSSIIPVLDLPTRPADPDCDDLYEDIDGNGISDFTDVRLFFSRMDWIAANEPVTAFDFNSNGRIEFDDIVRHYHGI
jgi:predicted phosphodiesterase